MIIDGLPKTKEKLFEKMEKYKLLSLGDKKVINIGDYIQALASAQFYPHVDGFIYREKLKDYDGENCNMIMNGWYMHDPTQWPPSNKIYPLFVALHINTSVAEDLLSEEGVSYLKKNEPIGCRDNYTRDLLLAKGVDAYFSGCMTLTLGNTYKSDIKDGSCYFVDPTIVTPRSISAVCGGIFTAITRFKSVYTILKKRKVKRDIPGFIRTANYYRVYGKVFSKKTLVSATYITQQSDYYSSAFKDDYERLKEAERLIKLYSRASLVVTGRIHCALPCLGLDTPVIFTTKKDPSIISSCRFGGLIDLFNVMYCDDRSIESDFVHASSIDEQSAPINKNNWEQLAKSLSERCRGFVLTSR